MNKGKPLVVFDMDGVLVNERSSWRIIHNYLGTSNEDSFQAYIRGEIDDIEFMRRDIKKWRNADPSINRESIQRILDGSTPMKGFPSIIKDLRSMGFMTAIISGGLDILAKKLSEGSNMDGYFANGIEFTSRGDLTGNGILEVPLRDKGSVFDNPEFRKMDPGAIISIGDSEVDITMFERSDLSIAFRPENDTVRDHADIVIEEPDLSSIPLLIFEKMA